MRHQEAREQSNPASQAAAGRHVDPSGPTDDARADCRRVFREMVRLETQDRPLSWVRRNRLVRFAEELGIDGFEARLVVRAVEYDCGHVPPAAMADVGTPADMQYAADAGAWTHWVRLLLVVAVAGLAIGTLAVVFGRAVAH